MQILLDIFKAKDFFESPILKHYIIIVNAFGLFGFVNLFVYHLNRCLQFALIARCLNVKLFRTFLENYKTI